MITGLPIGVWIRIQGWQANWLLIKISECRHDGFKDGWWVQSGHIIHKLSHVVCEIQNVFKLEVIGVSSDDEVETILKIVLIRLKAWFMWSRRRLFFLELGLK